jgi:hypothetical protein
MSAGAIMPRLGFHNPVRRRTALGRAAQSVAGSAWRLREAALRRDAGVVVLIGFTVGMGWAFVGSLLLGLGTGSVSKFTSWCWLAGELLIGATVFVVVLLGAPNGCRDGA